MFEMDFICEFGNAGRLTTLTMTGVYCNSYRTAILDRVTGERCYLSNDVYSPSIV